MALMGRRESRESPEGWMISRQRFEKLETNLVSLLPSLLLLLLLLLSQVINVFRNQKACNNFPL